MKDSSSNISRFPEIKRSDAAKHSVSFILHSFFCIFLSHFLHHLLFLNVHALLSPPQLLITTSKVSPQKEWRLFVITHHPRNATTVVIEMTMRAMNEMTGMEATTDTALLLHSTHNERGGQNVRENTVHLRLLLQVDDAIPPTVIATSLSL